MQQGNIVAVKGIGGFHLVCDATNDLTIAKLRERKGRIDKPFAVMVPNVEACREFAIFSDEERDLLESKARPIVLLRKKCGVQKGLLSELVAPHNNFIGVMLPYSPLHHLLLKDSRSLVMTSGNISDEPIVRENGEAMRRLSGLADKFLMHNRDIHVVCDDSVVRCLGKDLLPLRRSRGYAPMPIKLREAGPCVLAAGGELKATFCATKDQYAYMSQHLGDLGNLETLDAIQRGVDHFLRLFRIRPQAVVADLHPNYLSSKWARELAGSLHVPLIQVQHHHAHIASLFAEHALPYDRPIIGCCFDGTGFGTDHAIWGGEFLIADAGRFQRFAHIKYFSLPGGDESIRRPYRAALAQLSAAGLAWDDRLPCVRAASSSELRILRQQLERNINCVATSSMGRLFDAVASLIGVRQQANYEAQAAMEMEAIAASSHRESLTQGSHYPFLTVNDSCMKIDPSPMMAAICKDVISGTEPSLISLRFHHTVAQLIVDTCIAARKSHAINDVGLSGGVFQNVFLLELAHKKLLADGFNVFLHHQVPPNDGGLALGQGLIGQNRLLRNL
jgi:hydrogenase maturation protein HypF